MSSESPPHLEEEPRCACMEKEYIQSLNERFASYVSRVRQLRSLSGSGAGESSSLYSVSLANTSTVKIQENQITALKTMYERQLEELRTKLGEITRDRTQLQLATTKNTGLITELQTRLEKEANIRKKLEEALKDAQRAIADKEALLQDARNEAAQRENAHIETKQDRDGLLATLTRTQQTLEVEMAAKDELQNLANELKEKFHFQQQLSEKELSEMRCSLDEANKSIELIERRTHEEYDSSEEKISAMLAKIKNRHEMEFQKFKEESEAAYENGVRQIRIQLDDAFLNLETTRDDNVHLKAEAEALNFKVINLGAKCASLEAQKAELFKNLKLERQQAASMIKNLEIKLREADKALMDQVRQFGVTFKTRHPVNLEVEAFATLLEAEEKRLNLSVENKRATGSVRCQLCHPNGQIRKGSSTNLHDATHAHHHQPVTSTAIKQTVTEINSTSAVHGESSVTNVKHVVEPVTSSSLILENPSHFSLSQREDFLTLEVHPDGDFVRVFNNSEFKDEEIGGFIIRQNVAGRPVSLFRFPPETLLKTQTYTTVWSASSLSNHNPPSEFVNRDHHQWRTGPKCTTILCKPNGQPVSWTKVVCPRDREGKRFSNPPADAAYYSHRSKTSSFDAITERRIWRP